MTFSLDLKRFVEVTKEKANDAVGAIVIGVASRVDERSPVGDPKLWKSPPPPGYVGGHFRANWQIGVDSIPVGEIEGVDPSGEETQARIVAAIPDDAAGKVYNLVNNLPYARRLEEGWSSQAPSGMVELAVIEYQDIVKREVERLS